MTFQYLNKRQSELLSLRFAFSMQKAEMLHLKVKLEGTGTNCINILINLWGNPVSIQKCL